MCLRSHYLFKANERPFPVLGEDERIKQLLQLIRNKVEKREFE